MQNLDHSQVTHVKNLLDKSQSAFVAAITVESLCRDFGCSVKELMLTLLPLAADYSRPAISGFKVGALALGESGNLYFGANHEFKHAPLGQAIHAEQTAVVNAHLNGEKAITKLAVNERPCGHCRQFMCELSNYKELEILLSMALPTSVCDLLPHAFVANELGVEPAMMSSPANTFSNQVGKHKLTQAAIVAATNSYAPYSTSYAGVSLRMHDNSILSGSYLENVAFNPSVGAMHAALVAVQMHRYKYAQIEEVALAASDSDKVGHVAITTLLMQSLGITCQLQHVNLT